MATMQEPAARPPAQAGNAQAGKDIYLRYSCYACHGYAGHGGAGPRLVPMRMSVTAFTSFVRRPPTMPPYTAKVLSNDQLTDVWAYNQEELRPILVPMLLVLSAAKFALVVGFYMHLRFDHPLFTGVFGFGLAVAGSVITALMFLFGQYTLPHHGG